MAIKIPTAPGSPPAAGTLASAPRAPAPAQAARAPSRAAPVELPLSLLEYAILCVRLQMAPAEADAAFAKHGLSDPAKRKWIDDAWQARLRENPAEMEEWRGHVTRLRTNWKAPLKGR
jgi:hypothetical protein